MAAGADPLAARARVAAGIVVAVARSLDVDLPRLALLEAWGDPVAVVVAPEEVAPALAGMVHEVLVGPDARRRAGSFYTPAEVARVTASWALARSSGQETVCDPAVGGGAFLLAAAEVLLAAGDGKLNPTTVVGRLLIGADVDPVSVAVSEAVLALWCEGAAVPRMVVGDALTLDPAAWPDQPDVVVGNPPFQNQLARPTARSAEVVSELRARLGPAVTAYADTAVLFLAMAMRLVRPGGVVALILPQSFLASRDARVVRDAVLDGARLENLWVPSVPVFPAAAVRICVPVLRRSESRLGPVRIWVDHPARLAATVEVDADTLRRSATWSALAAQGSTIPDCAIDVGEAPLGAWCEIGADFRDAYYGVGPFLVDDPDDELDDGTFPALVTVGLVDPADCLWGRRPTRHQRRRWVAPRVDRARLVAESDLGSWAETRLVPKVVVATQTRVVEAAVDVEGRWLPSTPLISAVSDPSRLWHLAAALLAPPISAWSLRRFGGTALSSDALKLSAAQVRQLPSPLPGADWDAAASAVRQATGAAGGVERRERLLQAALASSRAYGIDDPAVVAWWQDRLPPIRSG